MRMRLETTRGTAAAVACLVVMLLSRPAVLGAEPGERNVDQRSASTTAARFERMVLEYSMPGEFGKDVDKIMELARTAAPSADFLDLLESGELKELAASGSLAGLVEKAEGDPELLFTLLREMAEASSLRDSNRGGGGERTAYCPVCFSDAGVGVVPCPTDTPGTPDDWISNVTFNAIDNTTLAEPTCSYGDYTGISTDLDPGSTHTLSVSFCSEIFTEHVRVWIDWDQSKTFDAAESYYLGSGVNATVALDITVPIGAALGCTTMRVMEEYSADPGEDPCNTVMVDTWGEAEDYTVCVLSLADCGDTFCIDPETCDNCPADCSACYCGNGTCDSGESCVDCPADCGTCVCGDGTCDTPDEDCSICPDDCGLCPPSNDDCGDATAITALPYTDTDVNIPDATDDANVDPSCDSSTCGTGPANNGVWYTYTPAQDCEATIDQTGIDAATSVWTGLDCAGLTQEICSDPDPFTVDLTGNVQYWILVSNWSCSSEPSSPITFDFDCLPLGICGDGTLNPGEACDDGDLDDNDGCSSTCEFEGACCDPTTEVCTPYLLPADCATAGGIYMGDESDCGLITCPTLPANDDCDGAEVLGALPASASGNTALATGDVTLFCGTSTPYQGVWYSVTGTGNTMKASTCNPGTDFDTKLQVLCGTCTDVWCVGGNDDATGAPAECDLDGLNRKSIVEWCSELGREYYILVGGYGTYSGNYELSVTDDSTPCIDPPDCEVPTGACCTGDSCVPDQTAGECAAVGGTYAGDDVPCNPCATGACCDGVGGCTETSQSDCDTLEGYYQGPLTTCDPNLCPLPCTCAVTITSFPYAEDFETDEGDWIQPTDDDMNWTRDAGGTGSIGTGPTVDHTLGTTAGFYMYTEATGPGPGDEAILESPCFDIVSLTAPEFRFWYHMHGAAMGDLHVEVSDDTCMTWNHELTLSGQQQAGQTDPWLLAQIDLSAYIGARELKIRFRGVIGSSYTSDMAIDDVALVEAGVPLDGACCDLVGHRCTVGPESTCSGAGQDWQGPLTTCDPDPCPPAGACCVAEACTVMTPDDCESASGAYAGDGTECTGSDFCTVGACCDNTGACTDVSEADCITAQSDWQGQFSSCTTAACPPAGACCVEAPAGEFTCSDVTEDHCVNTLLGTWLGAGTDCLEVDPLNRCDCNEDDELDINQIGGDLPTDKEFLFTDPPLPIPILDNTTIRDERVVNTDCATFYDVDIDFDATHTFPGDLDIFLEYDNGIDPVIRIELSTDNGGGADDAYTGTIFDDEADESIVGAATPFTGRYAPEGALSILNGKNKCATWTLEVSDDAGADEGSFVSWSLHFANTLPVEKTDCNDNQIPDVCEVPEPNTVGACCLGESCVIAIGQDDCEITQGGTYYGDCTDCDGFSCPPDNDDCVTAEALTLPADVVGDNTAANDDPESTGLCETSSVNQAIWYTVIGNGNELTATTCNPDGTFTDTKLQVWCGGCLDLVCVDGDDDDPLCTAESTLRSTVTWCSESGTTYYIAVGGYSDSSYGDIHLTVDEGTTCSDALDCSVPTGACCDGEICSVTTPGECASVGGAYAGDDVPCSRDDLCTLGACCDDTGACTDVSEADCITAEADWQGQFSSCATDPCPPAGACCIQESDPAVCACQGPLTQAACEGLGGYYLGDDTTCDPGPSGDPCDCNGNGECDLSDVGGDEKQYVMSPSVAIPDDDTMGVRDEYFVPDSAIILDLVVDLDISHTWIGDLCVTIEKKSGDGSGAVATVIQRIGDTTGLVCDAVGCCGCSSSDIPGIFLDDDATDPINDACPPAAGASYTPESPLSAFDGLDKQGTWSITVIDNAGGDTGILHTWSLHFANSGGGPGSEDCNGNQIPDECDQDQDPCLLGACWFSDCTCQDVTIPYDCDQLGGVHQGGGTDCAELCTGDGDCDDGSICTTDTCDCLDPGAGSDGCVHEYQTRGFGDIVPAFCEPTCPQPNTDDIICVLNDFADGPSVNGCGTNDPSDSTDLSPCGGDGTINVDDILAMLDAFGQVFSCPPPCP